MMKTHKIITLIIAVITAFSVLAISVSADYETYAYNNGLNQAIGSTSNVITVNGVPNPTAFSDEFSGGGNRNGDYYPTAIVNEQSLNYVIDRHAYQTTVAFTDTEDVKFGYVPVHYTLQPYAYYESVQHDMYYTVEGKYSNLFNGYDIQYLIPYANYGLWEQSTNRQIPEIQYRTEAKVTFLLSNGTKIEESQIQGTTLRGNFISDVTTSATILETINLALDKAYATTQAIIDSQEGVTIAENGRARLYLYTKANIIRYGGTDEAGKGIAPYQRLDITVDYPLTNSTNKYYPTTKTLPYNIVTNKIDSDFSLTEWLGASVRGIWRVEIIPHVTIGGIVTSVLGVAITIAFLKFFAGG